MEVYERLHKIDDEVLENGTCRTGWVDERSRHFAEEYAAKLLEKEGAGVEITHELQNDIFASLTRIHKRCAYGYGNQPTAYRSPTYMPSTSTDETDILIKELQIAKEKADEKITHLESRIVQIEGDLTQRLEMLEKGEN